MKDTEKAQKMGQGGQTSGPEVSRRQEMRHDGLTKEPADTINADQSAATFVAANNARSGDQTGVWPVRGADDEFARQGPIVNHCIATLNRYLIITVHRLPQKLKSYALIRTIATLAEKNNKCSGITPIERTKEQQLPFPRTVAPYS